MDYKAIVTDDEEDVLYKAVYDCEQRGATEILCPRCGKKLVYENCKTGYIIGCEDEKCIRLTLRGI